MQYVQGMSMCAIIGIFRNKEAGRMAAEGLSIMESRGRDRSGIESGDCWAIGHNLHAIVGNIKQPLKGRGVFAANCEIYNWKDLCQKYGIKAGNDAEAVFMMSENGILPERIDELDGDYALAYYQIKEQRLILARDLIGVKPLWFAESPEGFGFASEKKALERITGSDNIQELNPRKVLIYNPANNKVSFKRRSFYDITPEHTETEEEQKSRVLELLRKSIEKRVPKKKVGLLFSGGIDSTLLAMMLKSLDVDFTCYTAALESGTEAEDAVYARKVAEELGLKLRIMKIELENVRDYLKKIVPLIEDSNVVKVGVAVPFYVCCEQAKKDGVKVMLSGLGSEEIFA
ncbi:ATP-binding protein, partial [Candidatus Woesearchaeota archaeon]|nr:ATP-binding protein [Candidatus Woesearchaeota archaeon]